MRRKLSTVAAAISLMLCIVMAVLWVRSFGRHEWIFYHTTVSPDFSQTEYWVGWGNRNMGVGRNVFRAGQPPSPGLPAGWGALSDADPKSWFLATVEQNGHLWQRFGYAHIQTPRDASGESTESLFIAFPHWSAMLLFGVAPIVWLLLKIRRRRLR